MNYRHAFHAGNFADVVKHAVLARIVGYLQQKDAPIRIIGSLDTPVPYSPPLKAVFLPSDDDIERAARQLVAY